MEPNISRSCRFRACATGSILVNSMSKTYSVTGWRVGWVLRSARLTDSIRKVHDFLTVGAAAPLQQAGVLALSHARGLLSAPFDGVRPRAAITWSLACKMLVSRCFTPKGAY